MSATPVPVEQKPRRGHSVVGLVFLLISLALFALAGFHIWRMVQRGYSYACTNGDGCTYDSPDISGDLSWVTTTLPFAIIALVVSIMAFTFHRIRSAWSASAQGFGSIPGLGAIGKLGGLGGGFGSLPLIARAISTAIAGMRGGQTAWPGVTGTTIPGMPGVTWPGMPGTPGAPGTAGAGTPGAPTGWPGLTTPVPGTTPMPGADAGMASTAPDRTAAIQAMGLDGEAVISAMHDVGMVSGTKRMYELDLAVTLPGTATYRVKHMTWVPVESVGRLYAGGRLRAKIDPADHSSLVLDLTTPTTG